MILIRIGITDLHKQPWHIVTASEMVGYRRVGLAPSPGQRHEMGRRCLLERTKDLRYKFIVSLPSLLWPFIYTKDPVSCLSPFHISYKIGRLAWRRYTYPFALCGGSNWLSCLTTPQVVQSIHFISLL